MRPLLPVNEKLRRSPTPSESSRSPSLRNQNTTAYSRSPTTAMGPHGHERRRSRADGENEQDQLLGAEQMRQSDDVEEQSDDGYEYDDKVPLTRLNVPKNGGHKQNGRYEHHGDDVYDDDPIAWKGGRKRSWSAVYRRGSIVRRWFMHTRQRFWWTLLAVAIVLGVLGGGRWYKVRSRTIDGRSEPWYPSPLGGTVGSWHKAYEKAGALVNNMTLPEKVNITTGTGWMMGMCVGNTGEARRVGFPSLCLQDGPIAPRFADNITVSPAGISVGATFNRALMYKRGVMQGIEAKAKGINVLLGPCIGPLGRQPAGGRNWEGFGSDPVLQGIAAAATIRGIQEQGVIATIKHFVGNEQEHYRRPLEWGTLNGISSNIDDRTMHELYGWPFMDSIRAGVGSVMCSYNQVNHSYACQNSKLMNGLLKDEWGFQGFVQSDWLAQRTGIASALAGLDMTMPGDGYLWMDGNSYFGPHLTMAALNGSIPMFRLNDMVTRIVAAWYQMGQDEWEQPPPDGDGGPNFSSWTNDERGMLFPGSEDQTRVGTVNKYVKASAVGLFSHSDLARRIAAEAITLLKNDQQVLPLGRDGWPQAAPDEIKLASGKFKVAVLGEDAAPGPEGPNACADRGCNKGTLGQGWGSGSAEYPYMDTPVEAFRQMFYSDNVTLSEYLDNTVPPTTWGQPHSIEEQDLCIVFVNSDGGEGYMASEGIKGDRNNLDLQHGGDDLILYSANNCGRRNPRLNPVGADGSRPSTPMLASTIVVIHTVGPVIVERFIEHPNVAAVLNAHLPGQEAGFSLTDVIFGDLNPSGHLPYTMGKALADYGPGAQILTKPKGPIPETDFAEGLFVDYKWFDANRIEPRFEFGYGLSYTTFNLDADSIKVDLNEDNGSGPDRFLPPRPHKQAEPPHYDETPPDPEEGLAPPFFEMVNNFIYPWIKSTDEIKPDRLHLPPGWFPREASPAGGEQGGHPALYEVVAIVSIDVVNDGDRDGMAVPQLYLVFPNDVQEEPIEEEAGSENMPDNLNNNNPILGRSSVLSNKMVDASNSKDSQRRSTTWWPRNWFSPRDEVNQERQDAPEIQQAGIQAEIPASKDTNATQPQPILFPPRVLRGFHKVHVGKRSTVPVGGRYHEPPGETEDVGGRQRVTFVLSRRDVSYWSVRRQSWVIPNGTFGVEIGFSSRDIRARTTLW